MKKTERTRGKTYILGGLGLLLFVSGIVWSSIIPDEMPSLERLAAVFCGAGGSLIGVSLVQLLRIHRMTPEQEKLREIEQHDERNIQVNRAALCIVAAAAFIILAVLGIIFTVVGYRIPGLACSASVFVLLVVYVAAYKKLNKIM